MAKRARFEAIVVEGHKRVLAVLVPFDPEAVWKRKPVRLEGRRHGWLVRGTVNGRAFDGYVGERWGRFFITLDADAFAVGLSVRVALEPTTAVSTWDRAIAQSRATTQPTKARTDAKAR